MNPTDILKDKIGTVAHGPGTSFLELFIQAHLVVQIVMVGLLLASVWSWAIIIEKIFTFRRARREADTRMAGYREQSLRLHPWVCARCGREFTRANLHELTVHHKDHNHDNNPPDGSNWENLCLYCHDHEHQKYSEFVQGAGAGYGLTSAASAPKSTAELNATGEISKFGSAT